jgi:hypothetical protein
MGIPTTRLSGERHLLRPSTIQASPLFRVLLAHARLVPVHPIPPVRSPPPTQQIPQQHQHAYQPPYNPHVTSHAPAQPQYAQQFGQFLGVNDATAQMGLHVMSNVVGSGQEYVEQNVLRFINTTSLKPYFNVSTSYVVRKIRLLLFPWRHKPWSRQMRRNEVSGAAEGFKPPREDINAPDLYIPCISPPRPSQKPSSSFSHKLIM